MQVYLIQEKETEIIKAEKLSKTEALNMFLQKKFDNETHEIVLDDLFKYPELIPAEVQAILDSQDENKDSYKEVTRMFNEMNKIGYTFDSGLGAEPYNLQKIEN